MTTIDPSAPVLVTGATGYIAGWLVKALLERGCTVHATVRDPSDERKVRHLRALGGPGTLRLFAADLLRPGSFAEAMAGCALGFHTASPFHLDVRDPVSDLLEPAQLGTRNVLEEATRTPSVRRVVVTSSVAAMYGDNVDLQALPGGRLTEDAWNTTSSAAHAPYSWSKTMAEREAWALAGAQQRWDLVTINPCVVLGPSLGDAPTSESFTIIRQLGDGSAKTGSPRMGLGAVDVRDVADAHVRAGFTPGAHGRYIVAGYDSDLFELATILRARFGDRYPLPKRALPKWLVWLVGPLLSRSLTRRSISRNMNLPFHADNRRAIAELGVTYRPLDATLAEMFQQLIDRGELDRKKPKQLAAGGADRT